MEKPVLQNRLNPRQEELASALKSLNENASKIYIGGIVVLQSENPNRFALCAHSFRELITLLPKFIDVPVIKEAQQRLGDFADALVIEWEVMCKKERWPGTPAWFGEIDDALRRVLRKVHGLVEGHVNIKKGKKQQVKELIKKQNFSSMPLPETIEDLKIKTWNAYLEYFNSIAHHSPTTEADFLGHTTHFEDLLLNLLKPRTFEIHNELEKIIQEAER